MADQTITHTQPTDASAFSVQIIRDASGALEVTCVYRSPQGGIFQRTFSDSQITGTIRTNITTFLSNVLTAFKNAVGF